MILQGRELQGDCICRCVPRNLILYRISQTETSEQCRGTENKPSPAASLKMRGAETHSLSAERRESF